MGETFDVLIAGGGLAGLTSAYRLSRDGMKVLVLERGEYPGSKNVSGGVLFHRIADDWLPNLQLAKEAPFERYITDWNIFFLSHNFSSFSSVAGI